MALRCVYTDLDGTMLGPGGSLLRGPDGSFSQLAVRALEACHRAGVEVVIMSGRRQAQVFSDSRLIGQTSYIYEAGCAVMLDGERTLLTGDWRPEGELTIADQILATGLPELLFEHFGTRLEWHEPWHTGREYSLLMRGRADVGEANDLIRARGHADLRFLDNGEISRPMPQIEGRAHAYHLVPGPASKAAGVDCHRRARGYEREACIAIGDSIEDAESAVSVGHFFCVANGAESEAMRAALARFPNTKVTEGAMGDGFYEAVVSSLINP